MGQKKLALTPVRVKKILFHIVVQFESWEVGMFWSKLRIKTAGVFAKKRKIVTGKKQMSLMNSERHL